MLNFDLYFDFIFSRQGHVHSKKKILKPLLIFLTWGIWPLLIILLQVQHFLWISWTLTFVHNHVALPTLTVWSLFHCYWHLTGILWEMQQTFKTYNYRPRSTGDNVLGSVRPSVCPSVCPSVEFSAQFHKRWSKVTRVKVKVRVTKVKVKGHRSMSQGKGQSCLGIFVPHLLAGGATRGRFNYLMLFVMSPLSSHNMQIRYLDIQSSPVKSLKGTLPSKRNATLGP